LKEKINSICSFLIKSNIKKGDKIAILSESSPNWAIAFFAITSIGAIAVPIMTEFQPEEIHHILDESESIGIFVSDKFKIKLNNFDFTKFQFLSAIDDFTLIKKNTISDYVNNYLLNFDFSEKKLDNFRTDNFEFNNEVSENDIASLIYTSGTTGHSKGVLLSHKNFISDANATVKLSGINSKDTLLSILPLSHTMECNVCLMPSVIAGASVYYLDKPPTASVLLPALKIVRPTIMISIPMVIEKIYRQRIKPEFKKNTLIKSAYKFGLKKYLHKLAGKKLLSTFGGRLRMFCIGGAPLPQDVEDFLIEAKFPYTLGYGLTEASPLISGNAPATRRYRSSGQPIENVIVKILNPDKKTHLGEIIVNGPNVFQGYYKDEEKTKEIFTPDGWLRTGDLGYIDDDGYVYVKDRIKNVIVGSNGKNIYPEEVESKINDLQYVAESLVFQMEDRLVAKVHLNYVELEEIFNNLNLKKNQINEKINKILDDIHFQVNQKLPSYSKIVKVLEQSEPFAKTPSLKIKRFLYT